LAVAAFTTLRSARPVRDNLRHSSLSTTSMYLHSDDVKRTRQMATVFDNPAR
jgi:hypothetical protein